MTTPTALEILNIRGYRSNPPKIFSECCKKNQGRGCFPASFFGLSHGHLRTATISLMTFSNSPKLVHVKFSHSYNALQKSFRLTRPQSIHPCQPLQPGANTHHTCICLDPSLVLADNRLNWFSIVFPTKSPPSGQPLFSAEAIAKRETV